MSNDDRIQTLIDRAPSTNSEIRRATGLNTRQVSVILRRLQSQGTIMPDHRSPVKWSITLARAIQISPSLETKRRLIFESLLEEFRSAQYQIDSEWGDCSGSGISEEIAEWLRHYESPDLASCTKLPSCRCPECLAYDESSPL